MKLGIIGSGMIVQLMVRIIPQLEGIDVIAIQGLPDSKEVMEDLCRIGNIPHIVYSFEDLAELDTDTVYIAVPNFLHYDYCRKALNKGLNVIVEKPIASNDTETKELAALAEENHCFLFEAVTTPYFNSYRQIKEWLPRIGTVKQVTMNFFQYSSRYDAFRKGEVLPAFDLAKSGGALMDINLYNLHFVTGLFGRPDEVKYYANIERGIDTSGQLILKYPGFTANCTAAKDCTAPKFFAIAGTDGYITISLTPNLVGEAKLHLNDGTEETSDDHMERTHLIPEFLFFIDCINRNDYETCRKQLEQSILVSELQTTARKDAGIIFAADERR